MLNPVHLQTLQTVVQTRSIKVAANRLGYSASAVSQQMTALEKSVGVRLFERSAHSIRPTEAARLLARRTVDVVTSLDSVRREVVSSVASGRRRIRLGVFPSAAATVVPAVLRDRRWKRADIDLEIEVVERSALIERLAADSELDVVLTYRYEHSVLSWPSAFEHRHLADDPLVVVLPRAWPLAGRSRLAMSDLDAVPWISHTPATSAMVTLNRVWSTAGFRPRVVAHCDDYSAILALVEAGLAAAIVPTMVLTGPSAGVRARRPTGLDATRSVDALVRSAAPDPDLENLLVALQRHLRGGPRPE